MFPFPRKTMADYTGLPQEEINAAVREAFPQAQKPPRLPPELDPDFPRCPHCRALWKEDNSYGWSWYDCGTFQDDWSTWHRTLRCKARSLKV